MLDLTIPYWPLALCSGWVLGVATVVALSAWLSRRQRDQMLDELGKIAVSFEAQEGEVDATDNHSGN